MRGIINYISFVHFQTTLSEIFSNNGILQIHKAAVYKNKTATYKQNQQTNTLANTRLGLPNFIPPEKLYGHTSFLITNNIFVHLQSYT